MRCSAYSCINNAEGYCMTSDYVTIDSDGRCEEYEPLMTNKTSSDTID